MTCFFIIMALIFGYIISLPLNALATRLCAAADDVIPLHIMRYIAPLVSIACLGAGILSTSPASWGMTIPFVLLLILVTFCDIRFKLIPDKVILPGIAVAIVVQIFFNALPVWNYFLAALFSGGIFYFIALLTTRKNQAPSVGGGDIKFLFLIGLILGIKLTFIAFIFLSFLGTLFGLYLLLFRRVKGMVIPFGPFIAAGSLISYLWGEDWTRLFLQNLLL
ncbi:prepilin peptidase [Paenibacillus sp. MMO-58]|uniref:prepilin peptidase n=1 Tax=Paenibacillus sp. MMO-58 TaxID=3081290 RepID=UPI003019DF3E